MNDSSFLIRPFRPDDQIDQKAIADMVVKLANSVTDIDPSNIRKRADERLGTAYVEEVLKELQNPAKKAWVFVAEVDGTIAGYVFIDIHIPSPVYQLLWKPTKIGKIYDLFVYEQFRSKGIGKGLIAQAEKVFREEGCEHAFIEEVLFQNEDARRLYERIGYQNRMLTLCRKIS